MSRGIVLSLCDLSGVMVEPWVKSGHEAVLIDPAHESDSQRGRLVKRSTTVEGALGLIRGLMSSGRLRMVFAFPPCTDLAISGARWFDRKRQEDPLFQAKALAVVEQCRMVGTLSGCPWMIENPVGVLSSVIGKPSFYFHPYEFSALAPWENYTKKTGIWSGNGFVEPARARDPRLGEPDNRIHMAPDSAGRQQKKSLTPWGFAYAVFIANAG